MAKAKPIYEVVDEFAPLAAQIIEKYPTLFYGIDIERVRCVKITNKDLPKGKQERFETQAVKMPVLMDAPYGWYVTLYSSDWDVLNDSQKLLVICEVLHKIPKDIEEEGKVIPCDSKGWKTMINTFKGTNYIDNPDTPNILENDIDWIVTSS
jgi:hypothetical protein